MQGSAGGLGRLSKAKGHIKEFNLYSIGSEEPCRLLRK